MVDTILTNFNLKIKLHLIGGPMCNSRTIFFYFQNGISSLISNKLATISRFKGIKQMWIGADYTPTRKWQWRNYYKEFTGLKYNTKNPLCLPLKFFVAYLKENV
jgi:hypothetical protein